MHTIKITQRFLANQPWKNPHGENQSKRERDLFLQQKYRTEIQCKILLIFTTDFISKSGNCAQQKEPSRTPQNLCLKFADRTTIKHQLYHLENYAKLMQPYLDFCAAVNDWPYLDFRAAFMKAVLYRPYHDFQSIKCSRTVQ